MGGGDVLVGAYRRTLKMGAVQHNQWGLKGKSAKTKLTHHVFSVH